MSNPDENFEFSGKPKSAIFNRSRTIHSESPMTLDRSGSVKGKVKMLCSMFETPNASSSGRDSPKSAANRRSSAIRLPGTEDRIVVYLTSLRGVRKTYEDCYAVRTIFRGFRVWVDERDVSMDSAYKKELRRVLRDKNAGLPQVFIRGRLVGGADVIKQLFETGELGKHLQGFLSGNPGLCVMPVAMCGSCPALIAVGAGRCLMKMKAFSGGVFTAMRMV